MEKWVIFSFVLNYRGLYSGLVWSKPTKQNLVVRRRLG